MNDNHLRPDDDLNAPNGGEMENWRDGELESPGVPHLFRGEGHEPPPARVPHLLRGGGHEDPPVDISANNPGPPPEDDLDALLRSWHQIHTARALEAQDRILEQVLVGSRENSPISPSFTRSVSASMELSASAGVKDSGSAQRTHYWRSIMTRYSPIAAVLALLAVLIPMIMPNGPVQPARAQDIIYAPEGGKLEAFNPKGELIGPCPLKGTDVNVAISGRFTRVTLKQTFRNPYEDKIEAVYTFPMSHRAAVDRMTMTVGDRIIVGEVKERQQARRIYEAAREQGYVASLLEQERPNIFTQSVANIEPGATIDVQISYVELLESKDGTFNFDFPMVVGPRYIPGTPKTSLAEAPGHYQRRAGLILMAPASVTIKEEGPQPLHKLNGQQLTALLQNAIPIEAPGGDRHLWYGFEAAYVDGSKESGMLCNDGVGHVGGRWFCLPKTLIAKPGAAFSPDTDQVPDASKITPMPVRPEQRAGHDISVSVTIDTGGPGILDLKSELHDIITTRTVQRDDGLPRRMTIELKKEREIPNRDFVISWRQTADTIEEATFTHTGKHGNFFSLILQPPARVTDAQAVARELVFVLDTSGSMFGFPIEKAKQVMSKAIGALRPQDTFNLITFSGDTHILWDKPRPATKENINSAQQFLATRSGRGGTEMMKAIEAALVQQSTTGDSQPLTPDDLLNLPADGREVQVRVQGKQLIHAMIPTVLTARGETSIKVDDQVVPAPGLPDDFAELKNKELIISGRWVTENRRRVLRVSRWSEAGTAAAAPIRICCFMTDGYVGNDQAIIDAVKRNAKTTRVFSFGIGNSVNRYLLDGMARAGRGEVEYVSLQSDGDAAAKRFAERIQTPVLTDIELTFSDGLKVTEMVPNTLPDLFDVKPIILHGRYTAPGSGTLTIRGRTGSGRYERTIPLELPANQPEHDTIATLWARAKVEELMNEDLRAAQTGNFPEELRNEVVKLGETFGIMTQYTSFVAVEKQRVTIGGQPRLVHVPIEMPQGVSYERVFGQEALFKLVATSPEDPEDAAPRIQLGSVIIVNQRRHRSYDEANQPGNVPMGTARNMWALSRQSGHVGGFGGFGGGGSGDSYGSASYGYQVPAIGSPAPPTMDQRIVGLPRSQPPHTKGVQPIIGDFYDTRQERRALAKRTDSAAAGRPPVSAGDVNTQQLPARLAALKAANRLDWARQMMVPQRVAIQIGELVKAGKLDDAKALAEALVRLDGEFKIGVQMRDVLNDPKLAAAERDRRIAALADEARKAFDPVIRELKLRQRVDDRLLAIAQAGAAAATQPAPADLELVNNRLRVSVITADMEQPTLDALRQAGLQVEATAKPARLVIGLIAREKLADLALLDVVRRVEPTRIEK